MNPVLVSVLVGLLGGVAVGIQNPLAAQMGRRVGILPCWPASRSPARRWRPGPLAGGAVVRSRGGGLGVVLARE